MKRRGDTAIEPITWTNEKRKLKDLIPWSNNPRQIRKDQAERLVTSFEDFGQVETIAIGPNNEIYNGHQRLNVLAQKYGEDYEIEVRVASRPLSEEERKKLTVFLHKGTTGEWNFSALATWDTSELVEWGFKEYELGIPIVPGKVHSDKPEDHAYQKIIVHFINQDHLTAFSELLSRPLFPDTKSIWFKSIPEPEKKLE